MVQSMIGSREQVGGLRLRLKPPLPTSEEIGLMKKYLELRVKATKSSGDLEGYKRAIRDYAIFMTLLLTGRRIGEILSVYVVDIDWNRRIMNTIILKTKKGKKEYEKRPIGFPPELEGILKEYINVWGLGPNDPLFPISARAVQLMFEETREAVGIEKKIVPHSLRRYLITKLVERGWTYEQIKNVTGHKSVSTLQIYDTTTFFMVRDRFLNDVKSILSESEKSITSKKTQ